jgi:NDP-sugar pyrophosphorylase family protein
MGTAGALRLLSDSQRPKEPFFVMNGDLLTNVNFENMLEYHISQNAKATMTVREYDFQVPYGVVSVDNGKIISIQEKPTHSFFVSAGIYILDSLCIDMIPKNEFYDIPTLFENMIKNNNNIISFPLRDYWLDIGRVDEYEKAQREYKEVF